MAVIPLGSKLTFQETNEFVSLVSSNIEKGENFLTIDMATCNYLNSIMLSGLIRVLKLCDGNKYELELTNVNKAARTLLETTNVISLFKIKENGTESESKEFLEMNYQKDTETTCTISLKGSLNSNPQCSQFRMSYEENLSGIKNVILNCSSLSQISANGITELFRLRGLLTEKKGSLIVMGDSAAIESVWKMMHLESLIPMVENSDGAKKLLNGN